MARIARKLSVFDVNPQLGANLVGALSEGIRIRDLNQQREIEAEDKARANLIQEAEIIGALFGSGAAAEKLESGGITTPRDPATGEARKPIVSMEERQSQAFRDLSPEAKQFVLNKGLLGAGSLEAAKEQERIATGGETEAQKLQREQLQLQFEEQMVLEFEKFDVAKEDRRLSRETQEQRLRLEKIAFLSKGFEPRRNPVTNELPTIEEYTKAIGHVHDFIDSGIGVPKDAFGIIAPVGTMAATQKIPPRIQAALDVMDLAGAMRKSGAMSKSDAKEIFLKNLEIVDSYVTPILKKKPNITPEEGSSLLKAWFDGAGNVIEQSGFKNSDVIAEVLRTSGEEEDTSILSRLFGPFNPFGLDKAKETARRLGERVDRVSKGLPAKLRPLNKPEAQAIEQSDREKIEFNIDNLTQLGLLDQEVINGVEDLMVKAALGNHPEGLTLDAMLTDLEEELSEQFGAQ
jgi:hypothetical protein